MDHKIFEINKDKSVDNYTYTYYTVFGNHHILDDNKNPITNDEKKSMAYSRLSNESGDEQYFIKVGLYGKIFNPIGLFSEGKQNKFLSKIGKHEYNYKKVNKKVFDMYINFLRTKNIAWLNNAERELSWATN